MVQTLRTAELTTKSEMISANSGGVTTPDLGPASTAQGGQSPRLEARSPACCPIPKWYVLWTRTQCEHMVYDQLSDRGFHLFLPTLDVWLRRNGTRHRATVPMFPGYLFLNHVMDKTSYIDVTKARGLVRVLGDSWDALADVPDGEIATIRRLLQSGVPAAPHPYLRVGTRVRIVHGALEGVEGILVRTRLDKGLVVVSVNLLQRSVAVEVDYTLVSPL